jgi:endonuclease/exonuclease/phosphatase family metal-dependent hydrolase
MTFVRIMTFNVQLLPVIPVIAPNPGDEAEDRAFGVGKAIADLPDHERPQVIAFNEVFNEDGRAELLRHLKPLYPHVIDVLDDGFAGEDSGLMLVSQLPFRDLPSALGPVHNKKALFFSYPTLKDFFPDLDLNSLSTWEANVDALACKGVGVVQVDTAFGDLTIAFSHLQAFYRFETEYAPLRKKQFEDIAGIITRLLGPPGSAWERLVVMGDFNVRGDLGAKEFEWFDVFSTSPGVFSQTLVDGWRTFNGPPPSPGMPPREVDPGLTSIRIEPGTVQLPTGELIRLDYQCYFGGSGDRVAVPQHMRTRFRTLSDHWSLEADVNLFSPRCTPAHALRYSTLSAQLSGMRIADLDIARVGGYQWLYVDSPGTYTIFGPQNLECELYAEGDMSREWNPYADAHVSGLGITDLEAEVLRRGERLKPVGVQVDVPTPFLIRVRGGQVNSGFTGPCQVGVYRHTGETRETAIRLRPWEASKDPQLPAGQKNGPFDACWFSASIERALSGDAHTSSFFIDNNTHMPADMTLFDHDMNVVGADSGFPMRLSADFTTSGPDTCYMLLKRSTVNNTDFRAGWRSGITYLRSVPNVRPMVLRCLDETGPDALGDDEITLTLYADTHTPEFFQTSWLTADTGEILKLEGQVPEVAFVDHVVVRVKESDFIQGPAGSTTVAGLGQDDPVIKPIAQNISVESGTYRFEATLARSPQ